MTLNFEHHKLTIGDVAFQAGGKIIESTANGVQRIEPVKRSIGRTGWRGLVSAVFGVGGALLGYSHVKADSNQGGMVDGSESLHKIDFANQQIQLPYESHFGYQAPLDQAYLMNVPMLAEEMNIAMAGHSLNSADYSTFAVGVTISDTPHSTSERDPNMSPVKMYQVGVENGGNKMFVLSQRSPEGTLIGIAQEDLGAFDSSVNGDLSEWKGEVVYDQNGNILDNVFDYGPDGGDAIFRVTVLPDGTKELSVLDRHGIEPNSFLVCRPIGAASNVEIRMTPAPSYSEEFLNFQTQVAANGTEYTVGNDGVIRNGKGVEYLGINANPRTGEITIMVNGAPVVIGADKVSITDDGLTIEGYTYDIASGDFDKVIIYTADDLKKIPIEERPELVPASPEYTVGNVSTIEGKDNYVIVRDPQTGEATGAWNAFTGKVETMSDAGIKIFKLTDGVSELEMRSFKTVEAYREYLMNDPNLLWMQGDYTARERSTAHFYENLTPQSQDLLLKLKSTVGYNINTWIGDTISGDGSHVGEGEFTPIFIFETEDGSTADTKDKSQNIQMNFVEVSFDELKKLGQ